MKLFYLLLLISISSCTITKRVHQPGFHVQWNKQKSPLTFSKTLSSGDNTIESSIESSPTEEKTKIEETIVSTDTTSETEVQPTKKPTFSSTFKTAIKEKVKSQLSIQTNNAKKTVQKVQLNNNKPTEISESNNIANTLGILSFVLICVSIVIAFTPILRLLSFLAWLPFITFISSIITAICSLVIGKKNPENYTRKRLAIASLLIALVLFLLSLLMLLLMFMMFGF